MKKKLFLFVALFGLILSLFACNTPLDGEKELTEKISQELNIFKSDLKLTQDQVMSQIKAEYLLENKGYKDDDEIVILIKLEDDALIDTYNEKYTNTISSVSKYVLSIEGENQERKINRSQERLIETLKEKDLIIEVVDTYNTIVNAIAIKTYYKNINEISKLQGISNTILSETYNLPKSVEGNKTNAIVNDVDVYSTGIFNSSSAPAYTGLKTSVAVLDSGFDCSHTVFANQPNEIMISDMDVAKVLPDLNASKHTKGLELYDVYYSRKIPFVYDYADKDEDVFPYDSEHGTHVAGIIGGKDDEITGVAINTQLVLMKVFPDLTAGGKTEDILSALEDAVKLGVDAINLSLGTACGFTRGDDITEINKIYDSIKEAGISLLAAAGNDYNSAFGGEQGNLNKVTNPDTATVGSPSTFDASLSVASISGVKSKYVIANDEQTFFFNESNSVTAEENDFFEELYEDLGKSKEEDILLEYVTVPGVGLAINYNGIDVKGKIALVRRGSNTFEEKALNAKNAGAVGCIIYNNIEGDIIMSMGKTDHIPTISISKDDGAILAMRDNGTMLISFKNQAGPFMSDFSSWGPTPSLGLKPEITAHGGEIRSAVPGGGYDNISGTSMATPNLCGIVILIKQYLKEKYPNYPAVDITKLTNQLLMSTANIVLNEEGNPYSPRKQGAGLASLKNAVNTKGYITVDGSDKTKLELLDDPKRTGLYEMSFNVVNMSNDNLEYDLSLISMTESVSKSDDEFIAEKSQLLSNNFKLYVNDTLTDNLTVTVKGNETVKIKLVYQLEEKDKNLIDSLFPYGMYVEGFVKLTSIDDISLNIPFLAFYGDWTQAPLFDKTYYEVETEAHDASIDDEDKLKADYYATIPYGKYFYNYMIPLGTYLYEIDKSKYDPIPAVPEHNAISNILGTINGISSIYAGLLRNSKTTTFEIVDKFTGETIYSLEEVNSMKAHSVGGSAVPYYNYLNLESTKLELVNNRQYEFIMKAKVDYGDGGESTNIRNNFKFDFTFDDEAPIVKDAVYEKEYDKGLKKDRYYVTLTIYDNHYVQSITPIIFTSSSSYALTNTTAIPVYSQKGTDNKVRFEITEYLENREFDQIITNGLAFSVDDYALNSNIYICELPGTKPSADEQFKFTKDGTFEGTELIILSMEKDEVVDLTKYLASDDITMDEDKDYLKYLKWTSSNESIIKVKDGLVKAIATGRATVTVSEGMDAKQAILIINVKDTQSTQRRKQVSSDYTKERIKNIRFSYFDTLFAYSRAAQTSEIGETGDRFFISGLEGSTDFKNISFYPGEKIKLAYDFDPWYAEDNYELSYTSTNPQVAKVEEDGTVTGLKEGTTTIVLNVKGSTLKASIKVTIKNEFIIENRTLIAYKGLGGDVVIPDDEGILYIGSFAFCLYETDRTIELTEDDYDANKIPSMNTTIKSVVVPEGVMEIQKFAFYNCSGLEKVVLPESIKYIREYAFSKDVELKDINLENVQVIGREAFRNCEKLESVNFNKIYAIGVSAFEDCISLKKVDLTKLRNTGERAFKDCTSLEEVLLSENTKLSQAMFVNSGIVNIDIYEKVKIPDFCFAQCEKLEKVTINNDIELIGKGAFSECPKLEKIEFKAEIKEIGEQAFYNTLGLKSFTMPNNSVLIDKYAFYKCNNLEEIIICENTVLNINEGLIFDETNIKNIVNNSNLYKVSNNLLLTNNGEEIILASNTISSTFVLDENVKVISNSSFDGCKIETLIITSDVEIKDYAFANSKSLEKIVFPEGKNIIIGAHAFDGCTTLMTIENLDQVKTVKDYAFANTKFKEAKIASDATYGEGVFFKSTIEKVTIGKNTTFGLGAFQNCSYLTTVDIDSAGGVHFGPVCFAYDISLKNIDLSKVDKHIENQTFYGCTNLLVANLENVEEIGEYAFSDCSQLNYISMPKVKKIGDGAFSRNARNGGAPTIIEIIIPETLTELGEGVFIGCERLEKITLPSSLKEVPNYSFAYCLKLKEVVLPDTITRIGEYAFAGGEELEIINLEKVQIIDDYAFTSSIILKNISLKDVTEIGVGAFASTNVTGNFELENLVKVEDYAFQGTNIISFKANNLEEIGQASFQNNKEIKEFTLSNKVSLVGALAFNGCDALENLYYYDGEKLSNTGKINDYALLDNGCLYITLDNGYKQLQAVPSNLNIEKLVVLEDTYRIELHAGNANKNITSIVLPDSLKIIGNYAFYKYDNLKEVEFRSFTAPALESFYTNSYDLNEDHIGYDVLRKYLDLFDYGHYYYQFIDLAGKHEPIKMIVPKNSGIEGYDSIIYEVYFDERETSDYEAKDKNLNTFTTLATKVKELKVITLTDETLIADALTSLNNIKQDPTSFGYEIDEWNALIKVVKDAEATLKTLKLNNSSDKVKELYNDLKALDGKFELSKLSIYAEYAKRINELTFDERQLLDLTKYNEIMDSYNEYIELISNDVQMVTSSTNSIFMKVISFTALMSFTTFIFFKRKYRV